MCIYIINFVHYVVDKDGDNYLPTLNHLVRTKLLV